MSYDGSQIYQPIIVGPFDGKYMPAWLRLDGMAFICRWSRCPHRIEYPAPRIVSMEEILEHARSHGVKC